MKTALIIDDSRLARMTLKRLIVQHDFFVYEADGMMAAYEWLKHNPAPTVIFLDIMMPEIDGFAGLAKLKNNVNTATIPVIMYSGDTSKQARLKARDGGALGYLSKPADSQRVAQLLTLLLKRGKTSEVAGIPAHAHSNNTVHGNDTAEEMANKHNALTHPTPPEGQQPQVGNSTTPSTTHAHLLHINTRLQQLEREQALGKPNDFQSTQLQRDLLYWQRQTSNAQRQVRLALIMSTLALLVALMASIAMFMS